MEGSALSSHYGSLASKTAAPWWAEPAVQDHVADVVEKYLNLKPTSRLVDLGAGSGSFASLLWTRAGLNNPVTCVEPSQEMLHLGANLPGLNPVCQGAEERSSLLCKLLFSRYQPGGRRRGNIREGTNKSPFSFFSLPGSRSSSRSSSRWSAWSIWGAGKVHDGVALRRLPAFQPTLNPSTTVHLRAQSRFTWCVQQIVHFMGWWCRVWFYMRSVGGALMGRGISENKIYSSQT